MTPTVETILQNFYKDEMINFMGSHPEKFDDLFELAIQDKGNLSWRAAWLMWSVMVKNDERVIHRIGELIDALEGKRDGHQREIIKVLMIMDLPEEYEGVVFDFCIRQWEKIHSQPSVRYNAFKMIVKIAEKHPDLKEEVKFLVEEHFMDTLSPGIRNSLVKMMKGQQKL